MILSSRWRALGGGLATLLILAVLSLSAQEPTTSRAISHPVAVAGSDPPIPKRQRPHELVRHLPDDFGQVGLTIEQREAIDKIRARHLARIGELEAQVDAIGRRMRSESEQVLTDRQRQALALRRKVAAPGGPAASTPGGRDHQP